MQKVKIGKDEFWFDKKYGFLFADRRGRRPVQMRQLNLRQYKTFIQQVRNN